MSLFRAILRHPRLVVAITLTWRWAVVFLARRLDLRTAFSELLPDDDPGVVALHKTQKRMGDLTLLLVGVRSPDVAANERYAEALTGRLRSLPPLGRATSPPTTCATSSSLVESNRWLYASADDLEEVRDRLRREILQAQEPVRAAIWPTTRTTRPWSSA